MCAPSPKRAPNQIRYGCRNNIHYSNYIDEAFKPLLGQGLCKSISDYLLRHFLL